MLGATYRLMTKYHCSAFFCHCSAFILSLFFNFFSFCQNEVCSLTKYLFFCYTFQTEIIFFLF